MTPEQIKERITKHMPGAVVEVYSNDLVHYEAHVAFSGFQNKSRVERHRMVYAALGDAMATEIHALQLTTTLLEKRT